MFWGAIIFQNVFGNRASKWENRFHDKLSR
jgi:hypothetical protein